MEIEFPEGCKSAGVDIIRWPWRSQPDWPYYSEPPTGVTAKDCSLVELEITTGPIEAPADALLEAVGYYVRPGDLIQSLWSPVGMVHYHVRDGSPLGWHYEHELTGWDPYSWDVPRPRGVVEAVIAEHDGVEAATWFHQRVWCPNLMRSATWAMKDGACAYVLPEDDAPCPKCNGTGRVAGALGVGIEWPCECVGGAG